MKKSVWIFLFAVLLPSVVLGWLALRSAEEQQIVFERRTAELYQKETESLAVTVRDTVDAERRAFGETVHRLLAKGDAEALARDFTNTLSDAWGVKAVGFAINRDGKLASPSVASASKQPELQRFLLGNGGFLTSREPAIVYNWAGDNNTLRSNKGEYGKSRAFAAQNPGNTYANATNAGSGGGYQAKDAGQNADAKGSGNDVVILNAQGPGLVGNSLNAANPSGELNGLAGIEQLRSQNPVNLGSPLGLTGTQTVILNSTVQNFAQLNNNAGTFDFSNLMSVPVPQTLTAPLNGILQGNTANGGANGLELAQQKQGVPPLPMPMIPPAAIPAAGKSERQEFPSTAPFASAPLPGAIALTPAGPADAQRQMPADRDALADTAPTEQPGPRKREVAEVKMKSAQSVASDSRDKKSAESKPEHAEPDRPIAPAPAAPGGAAPEPVAVPGNRPRPEAMKADEMQVASASHPRPTAAMTDAAAPLQAPLAQAAGAPSRRSVETQAPLLPSPKSQAPSSKMNSARLPRKADASPATRLPEETPAEPYQMAKAMASLTSANNITRQVEPQQMLGQQSAAVSSIIPETAEFRSLTEEGDEGLVARFVQDKLNLIFWVRPPEAPEMVFGCLVEASQFSDLWKEVLERHSTASHSSRAAMEPKPEFVLALLDDRGRPVATQPADACARDWKRPFVASEIGEALPHWEAALYLASPTALAESARGLWRTLAFTIAGAVALIMFGGWLVVADARRQLALAQQKTDFVSNVSHELKTPLTSIRMFAELMHDRPQPPEKQGQYLRIITVEAERLTRLINNVLDFAKMGRKQKRLDLKPLDLHALVARVWESQELHLRDAGFTSRWEAAPGPYGVLGDEDALAQVLVNLLSNAEKYSNGNKEVELHTWLDAGWVNVSVLDRGMGVPDGDEKKIFEAFYRAHDSLASGIQGSGLGLTLAQRIAREHGGEIVHEHREGGGCRFTLRVPLSKQSES